MKINRAGNFRVRYVYAQFLNLNTQCRHFNFMINSLFLKIVLPDSDLRALFRKMVRKISNFSDSDWLFDFYNRHSDWLHFRHFLGYLGLC